jgi:hypothetical protein
MCPFRGARSGLKMCSWPSGDAVFLCSGEGVYKPGAGATLWAPSLLPAWSSTRTRFCLLPWWYPPDGHAVEFAIAWRWEMSNGVRRVGR